MRTVVRNSYTPKAGDYCNTIVIDKETNNQYLFDGDGVWTKLPADIDAEALIEQAFELSKAYIDQIAETIPTAVSQLENDSGFVTALTSSLVNYYTKALIDNKVSDLQSQIDAIASASDVVDVVGTYAQLQAYDASRLSDNDIIKVLVDETHDDAISYYRWDDANNTFVYVGSQGPFYTKSESDSRFVPQTRTINGKALSQNITLTAEDIGAAVYDASWLFNEQVATEAHLAELTDAIQNNTPIIVRQGDDSSYQTFSMTVTGYDSENIAVAGVLSVSEATSEEANLAIAAPTFTIDRSTREVTLTVGELDLDAIMQAIDDKIGFYGIIDGTSANPTDGASLAAGVYKASEDQNTSYISLLMEDGTTKRQSVAKGGIVIRTVSRLIVLGTQNLMYQYNTGDGYFYEGEPIVESVLRREYQDGIASLGTVTPPNTIYITTPINSLDAELNTGDTGHERITFTVEDGLAAGDFDLNITHASGDDVIWQDGKVPQPAAGETWIFEIYGKTIEPLRFTDTPVGDAVAWADITGKPTNVSYWTNDAGYITSAALPTSTSDLTNDSGFITNTVSDLANYYTQTQINNMFNSLPTVPTKTSDLTNDSGFITTADLPVATTSSLGMVQVGSGLSIDQNGVLSATGGGGGGSVAWNDITGKPTNVSYWTNDAGYITSADIPAIPTKTSDLTNDSGFITTSALSNYYTKSETYSQAEVNGLFNGLSTVASTGDYDDLTDKPQLTYTGTSIESRTVTQVPITVTLDGNRSPEYYGQFGYIPLDMSSYTAGSAAKALRPEEHLPSGAYVVTVAGYMRLGTETKLMSPGHIIFWDSNSGELDLLGYNACEYWSYDSQNDAWEGGYFTTASDVEYMIEEKMPNWTKISSGAFIVANKDPGYYTFAYSSASGTNRRITINVEGTNTYYYPYNDTVLIKSENGVLMLGRYNLWFEYDSTNSYYKQPVSIAQAFTGTDGTNAGTAGLVPAPAATDAGKFLKSDGTWATAGGTPTFINDYLTLDTTTGQYTITQANAEALRDLVIAHTPLYYKEDANYVGTNAMFPISATWTTGSPYGDLVLHADGPYGGQITFDIEPGLMMQVYMGSTAGGRNDGEVAFAYPTASQLYSAAEGGGTTVDVTSLGSPYYWFIYALNGINYFQDSVVADAGSGSSDTAVKVTEYGWDTRNGVSYEYFKLEAPRTGEEIKTVLYRLSGTTLTVLPLETESVLPDNLVYSDTGTATTPTPWIHTDDIQDDAVTADKLDYATLVLSGTWTTTSTIAAVGNSLTTNIDVSSLGFSSADDYIVILTNNGGGANYWATAETVTQKTATGFTITLWNAQWANGVIGSGHKTNWAVFRVN